MSITSKKTVRRGLRYHVQAYHFVFAALRLAQQRPGRAPACTSLAACEEEPQPEREETGHISGRELLAGIRNLALQQFGLMTIPVFRAWGIESTDDFGRIVFELIERGEMRKTERDRLSDFCDVFDFEEVFDRDYRIDTRAAFRRPKGE